TDCSCEGGEALIATGYLTTDYHGFTQMYLVAAARLGTGFSLRDGYFSQNSNEKPGGASAGAMNGI
ncbi:hypothetical protein, partial [Neolewinella agarilytica]|uniref:hypothetical protein n=1 Tax=Neolewinella agarilytica TaxID=478744 RepID=UPI002354D3EB